MKNHLGLIYASSAYLWWGIIPIFWKQIDHVPSVEIVAHRVFWGCLIVLAVIGGMREWPEFRGLFKQREVMVRLLLASLLMTFNWLVFIWAVNNGRIVETSLGYFINPLITVLFGVLFFGETLRKQQMLALLLAGIGVVFMVVSIGGIPMVSLSLAISFSLYSVLKKKVAIPAGHGLAVETLLLIVPATAYLVYLEVHGSGSFGADMSTSVLLILAGLFTLIPLSLFAAAAKKISLTALGMIQYSAPTCQLIIGVLLYNEPFGQDLQITFGLIWLALLVYSIDQLKAQRDQRRLRRAT